MKRADLDALQTRLGQAGIRMSFEKDRGDLVADLGSTFEAWQLQLLEVLFQTRYVSVECAPYLDYGNVIEPGLQVRIRDYINPEEPARVSRILKKFT